MKPTTIILLWLLVVSLVARSEENKDVALFTHQYVVPPTFLDGEFTDQYLNARSKPPIQWPKTTAKQVLQRAGVHFADGTLAIYNAGTSTLLVTNTKEQLELVEAYIDILGSNRSRQIYIQMKDVYLSKDSFNRLQKGLDDVLKSHLPWFSHMEEIHPERGFLAGSLPKAQTQLFINKLLEDDTIKTNTIPSLMLRDNSPGIIQIDQRNYGVTADIKKKNTQAILSLYLPPSGEALIRDPNNLHPDVKTTIWDGSTAVIKKSAENGGVTLVLVTVQLVDPAGQVINPEGG